jgi:hypothetical protein
VAYQHLALSGPTSGQCAVPWPAHPTGRLGVRSAWSRCTMAGSPGWARKRIARSGHSGWMKACSSGWMKACSTDLAHAFVDWLPEYREEKGEEQGSPMQLVLIRHGESDHASCGIIHCQRGRLQGSDRPRGDAGPGPCRTVADDSSISRVSHPPLQPGSAGAADCRDLGARPAEQRD